MKSAQANFYGVQTSVLKITGEVVSDLAKPLKYATDLYIFIMSFSLTTLVPLWSYYYECCEYYLLALSDVRETSVISASLLVLSCLSISSKHTVFFKEKAHH